MSSQSEWVPTNLIQIVRPLNRTFTTRRYSLPPTLNTTRPASMMLEWA